jgi:hypothetical protein
MITRNQPEKEPPKMKLLIAVSAKNWKPTASRGLDQSRRNQIGAALRLLADRLQMGHSDGTMSGPELEVVFRIDSPADETADAA